MKTIIVDPFPREMDLIFSRDKLVYLKKITNLLMRKSKIKNIFTKKIYQMQIL